MLDIKNGEKRSGAINLIIIIVVAMASVLAYFLLRKAFQNIAVFLYLPVKYGFISEVINQFVMIAFVWGAFPVIVILLVARYLSISHGAAISILLMTAILQGLLASTEFLEHPTLEKIFNGVVTYVLLYTVISLISLAIGWLFFRRRK